VNDFTVVNVKALNNVVAKLKKTENHGNKSETIKVRRLPGAILHLSRHVPDSK